MRYYETVNYKGKTYIALRVLASAFCVSNNLFLYLVRAADKGEVKIYNDEAIIPYTVFKRLQLPQDHTFFEILAVYLKDFIAKGEKKNG